jgi:hypothetical protein
MDDFRVVTADRLEIDVGDRAADHKKKQNGGEAE